MISCIQRVTEASVKVDGVCVGEISAGLLVLLGIEKNDPETFVKWMADKIVNLRIFEDDQGKMSRSVLDIGGSILVVSQFTLAGNASKGRRPDFTGAEVPSRANELYMKLIEELKTIMGDTKIANGVFGAHMEVSLVNDGPVTILVEKK